MKKYILLALIVYLIIINVLGFILMHIDKKNSKKRRRRIPERVLMSTAVFGGSIGIMAGMEIFRHKTKHNSFRIGVPVTLVLEIIIVAIFYLLIR